AISRLKPFLKSRGAFEIGKVAEDYAIRFLSNRGFRLLERNFTARRGEIDLTCVRKHKVYFFEVRYRSTRSFGSASESISNLKLFHLYAAIFQWIRAKRIPDRLIGGVYAVC